jgi:hypothetical protein
MNKIKCSFCDRKGLLIYPVRYAVACPAGAAAVPGLSGNFKIDGAPAQTGTAKYTLRALRAGYLYSYDEKRRRLKAYIVMPMGYLRSFPTDYPAPNPAATNFACVEPGDVALAHCVDIEHTEADPAGALWLGWSSVVWTKALLRKIDDAAWRTKHMQKIDIKAMLAGSAAHSEDFASGHKKVAHFAIQTKALHKAFDFSNTAIADEADQHVWAADMARFMATQAPHHRGFIVAVNDPVGITNDLSELTLPTMASGFDETMYRASVIADLLGKIESTIRERASTNFEADEKFDEMASNTQDENAAGLFITGWKMVKAGGADKYEKRLAQDKLKYSQDLAGRQTAAADHAWEDMTHDGGQPVLDQARLAAFPAEYEKALKVYEPIHLNLAQAHLGWLISPQLYNWMDGVHDGEDIRSGYAYSESMAQCIGKAVSGQLCINQLSAWLNSDKISDIKNLYVRALLFNQTAIIAATESQIKARDLQFESAVNIHKEALARLDRGDERRLFDRLALTTANVLIAALKHGSRSTMYAMATLHLRLLGGVAVKPGTATPEHLARWIIGQAEERGIRLTTTATQSKTAALREANRITRSAAGNADVIYLELDIKKMAQDGRIDPGSMKEIKIPGIETTRRWLGSGVPSEFHTGVAVTIIQLFLFGLAAQDLASNDRINKNETRFKAGIAALSLASTAVDIVATLVHTMPTHPLAAFVQSQWASAASRAELVSLGARSAGVIAGALSVIYDLSVNARNAFNEDKYIVTGLYGANAGVTAWIIGAGIFSSTSLWPFFVASILLSIAIAIVNMGELKKWISKCYFSRNFINNEIFNSYNSLNEELKSFDNLTGE